MTSRSFFIAGFPQPLIPQAQEIHIAEMNLSEPIPFGYGLAPVGVGQRGEGEVFQVEMGVEGKEAVGPSSFLMGPADLRSDLFKVFPDAIGTETDGLGNDRLSFLAVQTRFHRTIRSFHVNLFGWFCRGMPPGRS